MELIHYIILGIIQGLFEWLPISSQGNVVLILTEFFKMPLITAFNYSIFLHLGTALSAIVYFRKEIFKIFNFKNILYFLKINISKNNKSKNLIDNSLDSNSYYTLFRFLVFSLIMTFLVSGIIYFLFINSIGFLSKYIVIIVSSLLILTGILQLNNKSKVINEKIVNKNLTLKNSLLLGFAQGFSVLPGVSRSAITTSTLLLEKFNAKLAFKYSFILSIPTVILAEIAFLFLTPVSFNYYILISLVVAFVVGYFTIHVLITLARKINFAYICFIIALFYILVIFI